MFVWKSRLARSTSALAIALAVVAVAHQPLAAAPAAPTLNPAAVVGTSVTLSWNAVAGAAGYRVSAGFAPGVAAVSFLVSGTTTAVAAPFGTFYLWVTAGDATGESAASNVITVVVSSTVVAPGAPTGLAAFINGRSLLLTWANATSGGVPTTLVVAAGTSTGASNLGQFPVGVTTQMNVPVLTGGTYYIRVFANNSAGSSATSNEVVVAMPAGGGCTAPPATLVTPRVFGRYVGFSWPAVAGVAGYRLDLSQTPGGTAAVSLVAGPTTTNTSINGAPLGTFYARMTTVFGCGTQTTSPEVALTVDGAPPPGPRTPNPNGPTPPNYLPLPNRSSVVDELARRYPGEVRNSCGNNAFLFRVVERLRRDDNRWGLNWKRRNVGDMSQDVVTYNYGSDSDEGTQWVHVVDIISGHCGGNPSSAWINQTQLFSTGAQWTLVPYLNAGYQP